MGLKNKRHYEERSDVVIFNIVFNIKAEDSHSRIAPSE
jgi:hypothetical protein